jgi:hypothetical protein
MAIAERTVGLIGVERGDQCVRRGGEKGEDRSFA